MNSSEQQATGRDTRQLLFSSSLSQRCMETGWRGLWCLIPSVAVSPRAVQLAQPLRCYKLICSVTNSFSCSAFCLERIFVFLLGLQQRSGEWVRLHGSVMRWPRGPLTQINPAGPVRRMMWMGLSECFRSSWLPWLPVQSATALPRFPWDLEQSLAN